MSYNIWCETEKVSFRVIDRQVFRKTPRSASKVLCETTAFTFLRDYGPIESVSRSTLKCETLADGEGWEGRRDGM